MAQNSPDKKTQIVHFSHGDGPLPILGNPGHQGMVDFMTQLPSITRTHFPVAKWARPIRRTMLSKTG